MKKKILMALLIMIAIMIALPSAAFAMADEDQQNLIKLFTAAKEGKTTKEELVFPGSENLINKTLPINKVFPTSKKETPITPLVAAIINNHLDTVKALLNFYPSIKEEINKPLSEDTYTLDWAVGKDRNFEIVKSLINEGGAEVRQETIQQAPLAFQQELRDIVTARKAALKKLIEALAKGEKNIETLTQLFKNTDPKDYDTYLPKAVLDIETNLPYINPLCAAIIGISMNAFVNLLKSDNIALSIDDTAPDNETTPIVCAIRSDDLNTYRMFTKDTPSGYVNSKNVQGNNLLHIAAKYGTGRTILALKGQGADVNAKGDRGDTALHMVMRRKDKENISGVTNALLTFPEIDLEAKNDDEKTPLALAQVAGQDVATMLETAIATGKPKVKPIKKPRDPKKGKPRYAEEAVVAAYNGDLEKLKTILPRLANINTYLTQDQHGLEEESPLNILSAAVIKKHKDIVSYLLSQETVNVNASDALGRTPLFYALLEDSNDIITALQNARAQNINAQEILFKAVDNDDQKLSKVIIESKLPLTDAQVREVLVKAKIKKKNDIVTILEQKLASRPGDSDAGKSDDGKSDDEKPKDEKPASDDSKPKPPVTDTKELLDSLSALAEKLAGLVESLSAGK